MRCSFSFQVPTDLTYKLQFSRFEAKQLDSANGRQVNSRLDLRRKNTRRRHFNMFSYYFFSHFNFIHIWKSHCRATSQIKNLLQSRTQYTRNDISLTPHLFPEICSREDGHFGEKSPRSKGFNFRSFFPSFKSINSAESYTFTAAKVNAKAKRRKKSAFELPKSVEMQIQSPLA